MLKKQYSEAEIWLKITRWCDYQDRSQLEVRDKLYSLGLHKQQVELLISQLVSEGFLNEERFAVSFARGKFRMLQWGKVKIKLALQQKKISEYCIRKALSALPEEDYRATIAKLYQKKLKTARGENVRQQQYAAAQYVISRGFEPALVQEFAKLDEE
jgi:regulatory protein